MVSDPLSAAPRTISCECPIKSDARQTTSTYGYDADGERTCADHQADEDSSVGVVKLCCCAMNKAEAALGVLLKGYRDVDEELLLWEHIVRYQRTRASGSAHSLRRGADNDDLVRCFVGQVGDNMLKEIVGSR